MLEAVLRFINNWFERETFGGRFAASEGVLSGPAALADGQYYRIRGSVFNDGLHQMGADDLTDEEFVGEVDALAIPKAVVDLSEEIAAWCDANAAALASPYTSESFGGYSYSKASGGGSYEGGDAWKAHFRSSLNAWRKL